MSTKAKTKKGRIVEVKPTLYGTSNHGGVLFYGGVVVAAWRACSSGTTTLEDALTNADEFIDKNGLFIEEQK